MKNSEMQNRNERGQLTDLEQRALEIYMKCAAELLGRRVEKQDMDEELRGLIREMRDGGIYELASFSFMLAEGFEEFRNEWEEEKKELFASAK